LSFQTSLGRRHGARCASRRALAA